MVPGAGHKPVVWVLLLVFLIFTFQQAVAADDEGIKTSTNLQLQLSSMPEAKFILTQSFGFPFLQGTNPLTRDNNITADLSAEVSPISLNGKGEIIFTPAAFFLLSGGGKAGSGWNIPLGKGIGLNTPEGDFTRGTSKPRNAEIIGNAFDGLYWSGWGAGTLQFDLGAIIPGDWTHVLFQTRQEFRYHAYTRAGAGDCWIFENDFGENQNGWIYYAVYVLGYHMPQSPVLDTIAFMAELEKILYNTPGGDYWGEHLGYWIFSGLFNFSVNPRFGMTLALQMHTRRNFGTSYFYDNTHYYKDFELQSGEGQRRILFYRAALMLNYKIR